MNRPLSKMICIPPVPQINPLILTLREQQVLLDADLARVYGVPTRVLNQALKRNASRFPADFAFQLSAKDLAGIRSQPVIESDPREIGFHAKPGNEAQPKGSKK
jgi:hypothetical protein